MLTRFEGKKKKKVTLQICRVVSTHKTLKNITAATVTGTFDNCDYWELQVLFNKLMRKIYICEKTEQIFIFLISLVEKKKKKSLARIVLISINVNCLDHYR